jgi:retron-type reverse transcriptase
VFSVRRNSRLLATTRGTPQGGVISPLLANIVLDHLDWQLDSLGYRFVRYADDFVVLCQSKPQAEEALNVVRSVLAPLASPSARKRQSPGSDRPKT